MATKKTTGNKRAATKSNHFAWFKTFRRQPFGRALILGCFFVAIMALIALIAGTNLSLFLLLTGIFLISVLAIAWILYLTLREKPAAKRPATRKRSR